MQNRDKIEVLSETQPSQFGSVPLCKQGSVGFKPEPETVVLQDDSPQKKRPKTTANHTLNPQCSTILKELMKHPTLDAAGFSTNSNKAGRATMLKSRFADTINRAQQKMKVLKDDPMKMKQEKQILETRELLQDKKKTEAANAELKEQRERATNSDLTTSSTVVADSAMLAQDTIKTVVVNSAKNVSPMKIHNEKKRYLERRQLEENAKTSGSSSAATK